MDETFKNLNIYFKVSFVDLNMVIDSYLSFIYNLCLQEMVLTTIFEQLAPVVGALHESFSRKIWKHCLDNIILLYTQTLLNSASKIKNKQVFDMPLSPKLNTNCQVSDLLIKLNDDIDLFGGAFKDVLGNTAIESSKKIIMEIKEFLESSPEMVTVAVIQLRKTHGPGFSLNTIVRYILDLFLIMIQKLLINLRTDIESKEKTNILQSCKEVGF